MKLAIVGHQGGTNIGASLHRAAIADGHDIRFFDASEASRGARVLRALSWRLGKRPMRLERFSSAVVEACRADPPRVLVATGAAPLTASALRALRDAGTTCVNYSTDDPWSPGHRANWHLEALPFYNIVFTPRRANMDDFVKIGCPKVEFLPFGYDEELFRPLDTGETKPQCDVLFVGGADPERVAFLEEFMRSAPAVTLVGDYWERFPATARHTLGHKPPETLRALTASASINLCLVRRSNRDGHVMRSLEIGAMGGCMLAEDTAEHRELFGPDRESVWYFRSAGDAAKRARDLLAQPPEMRRLAESLQKRVLRGGHGYRDRLSSMVTLATRRTEANT